MEAYIGTKLLNAVEMTLGNYNGLRGWDMPEGEVKDDPGYLVEYIDSENKNHPDYEHYISWSPKIEFESAYRLTTGMNFGLAIEAMKMGKKVAREGWNGKGMFCIYVPGTASIKLVEGTPYQVALKDIFDEVEILPHFDMFTVNAHGRQAMLPGWLASQSDMDASDWNIVE